MAKFFLCVFLLSTLASFAFSSIIPDLGQDPKRGHLVRNAPRRNINRSVNPVDGLFIEARDNWFKHKDEYVNYPRIFDPLSVETDGCPADQFELDCNVCSCYRRKGKRDTAICTLRGCSTPQIVNWENGHLCPSFSNFYFKCNNCTCHESGRAADCTTWDCPIPIEA